MTDLQSTEATVKADAEAEVSKGKSWLVKYFSQFLIGAAVGVLLWHLFWK